MQKIAYAASDRLPTLLKEEPESILRDVLLELPERTPYACATRRSQAVCTLKWWQEVAPLCEVYVSQHVNLESDDGGPEYAARRRKGFEGALRIDGMTPEIKELAATLLNAHAIPQTEPTDALHIATDTVYGMDAVLTWNCKHMANPVALPKTVSTISKAGYECPVIITPMDFLDRKEEFGL